MRHNKLRLYVHLIWSTWNRWPLITAKIERALYREMEQEAVRLNCKVLAVGGVDDHVHLLLEMPPTAALSDVVKQIKGASSLFVNDTLQPAQHFKWQGAYAAFTVSPPGMWITSSATFNAKKSIMPPAPPKNRWSRNKSEINQGSPLKWRAGEPDG